MVVWRRHVASPSPSPCRTFLFPSHKTYLNTFKASLVLVCETFRITSRCCSWAKIPHASSRLHKSGDGGREALHTLSGVVSTRTKLFPTQPRGVPLIVRAHHPVLTRLNDNLKMLCRAYQHHYDKTRKVFNAHVTMSLADPAMGPYGDVTISEKPLTWDVTEIGLKWAPDDVVRFPLAKPSTQGASC